MLLGEEADQEPPGALVRRRDETVNPPMLSSDSAMGMLLTARAGAYMNDTPRMFLGHVTVPP